MRTPIIAGNWKMFKLHREAVDTAVDIKQRVSSFNHCEIVVAPVFTALKTVADRLEGSNVRLAAQDCSTEPRQGARTGEICADMIRDAGAKYVIVGHSERRQYLDESDEDVNAKAKACIVNGLNVIVCVGENLSEREAGEAENVVASQLSGSLKGLTVSDAKRMIIAYEPVWAIGTGKTASPEQAQEMHAYIRRTLGARLGAECAAETRILYGGSVKPENVKELMSRPDIDGALVGGASLEAESFAKIVNYGG